MTDLLTKVKEALEEHESFWDSQGTLRGGETTPLEDLAPDTARALIAAGELADAVERDWETANFDDFKDMRKKLDAFRAATEGRTND